MCWPMTLVYRSLHSRMTWLTSICLVATSITCVAAPAVNKSVIPRIAHIGSITLGTTTMEHLQTKFGTGLPFTGGHPRGAREWIITKSGCIVDADGFDYNQFGRVVDSFDVSQSNGYYTVDDPIAHVTIGSIAFLGAITPGMRKSAVEHELKLRHVTPYVETPSSITIEETGNVRVNSETTYTTWTARLFFTRGRLSDFELGCD
jgi:hypothetical protein